VKQLYRLCSVLHLCVTSEKRRVNSTCWCRPGNRVCSNISAGVAQKQSDD
jgi:hypothetical protein